MDLKAWLADQAFVLYLVLSLLVLIAACQFLYAGWIKKEKDPMYRAVTIGLCGLTYMFGVYVYTRTLTLAQNFEYLYSWWWPLRLYVPLFAAAYIVAVMAWRMWKTRRR